jgi:hypothetical protein
LGEFIVEFYSDNSVTSAISNPQTANCQDPVIHVSYLENSVCSKPLQQQQAQFLQVGANYIPHNPTGVLPISSYYSMHPAQPQQQFHYQPIQLCPVYYVPVGQMAPYNLPAQCGLVNTAIAPHQPPMHPNPSLIAPQVAYKEATVAPSKPDLAPQIYRTGHAHVAMPLPHNENQQQPMESANFRNELEDDPAGVQIYKSQPPPPSVLLSSRH